MRKILFAVLITLFLFSGTASALTWTNGGGGEAGTTVGGLTPDTIEAGDDGKYLVVDWGNSKIDYGTPAGGGDMTQAVWDGDTDGFIDADAGGTDINTSASTGVPSISAGTWSVAATLTHELGGLEADASAYDGLLHITAGTTSAKSVSANGLSLVAAANYAAMRTLLDLEAATDFYAIAAADAAFEAELDNSAGLLAALSDETGTGVAVFGTNPTLTGVTITGDVTATGAAMDFDLIDNNASALSFDATGKAGIINIITTDAGEGVEMSGTLTVAGAVTSTGVLTATAAGANITAADAQLIDLSGITHTAATDEGFVLPTWADVSPTTDQAYLAYDTAANAIKVYDGGWLSFATEAAPLDAKYIVQQADATLTAEQALGALASGIVYNTTTTGVLSIASEANLETTLGIGFGTSKAATSGYILVMDGTDLESVAMSGDATIAAGGAVTIAADSVALTTDTTGNYTASIADAGNTTITVVNGATEAGAVTLDAVDLNCTNCINETEIEDLYVLLAGDTVAGNMVWNGTQTFNGVVTLGAIMTIETTADEIQAASGQNVVFQMGDAIGANKVSYQDSGGTEVWAIDSDGVMSTAAADDGYWYFDPSTASESEWWIGPNHDSVGDDNDAFEIRQSATQGSSVELSLQPDGDMVLTGDLTITGDDLFFTTNTAGHLLINDGTNFNPTAVGGDATLAGDGTLSVADLTIASEARGDIVTFNPAGVGGWERLAVGAAGKVLTADGTDISWEDVTATAADAATVDGVQYEVGGSFTAETAFAYAQATNTLTVENVTLAGVINIATDIVFTEAADHASTPGAGYGYLWVKSTDPSTLIFTDDAGTDLTVGTGSGDFLADGTVPMTGTLDLGAAALIDATGAVDMDYGSADVLDHTFISDGGTVIIDGTISTAASAEPEILITDSTTSGEAKIDVTDAAGPDVTMELLIDIGGTLTPYLHLDGVNQNAEIGHTGATGVTIISDGGADTMTLGNNTDLDFGITFDSDTDDATINWDEANSEMEFDAPNYRFGANADENIVIVLDADTNDATITYDEDNDEIETASNIIVTGHVDSGTLFIETTTDVDVTVAGSSRMHINNHASAINYTLPADPETAGGDSKTFCFRNRQAQVITITPAAGDVIELDGTDASAAEAIVSTGAVGEFMCLMGFDDAATDRWLSMGYSGTWAEATP